MQKPTCSSCPAGIDIFPLKKCEANGGGGGTTGPTGPQGKRGKAGPAGTGVDPNYLWLVFTTTPSDPIAIGPQPLVNDDTTNINFGNDLTNSGDWPFTIGQSTFTIPEDGTYRVTFDPNVSFRMNTGTTPDVAINYVFEAGIAVDAGMPFDRRLEYSGILPTGLSLFRLNNHIEGIFYITAGQVLTFQVTLYIDSTETPSNLQANPSTSATIQRIA